VGSPAGKKKLGKKSQVAGRRCCNHQRGSLFLLVCRVTAEVCCQLDGNGGVLSAGVWRWLMDLVDLMDLMDKMGAPCDTPGEAVPLSGLARA